MKISVRSIIRTPWSAALLAALLIVMMPHGAQAQAGNDTERNSIVLSPVSQRFDIKAGTDATSKLTVINDGTSEEKIILYGRPYSVKSEAYQPDYESKTANTDVYQWVRFDKTTYTLQAGQSIDIPYSLHVPAGAAPGGHYGVIFVETQPKEGSSDAVIRKKRVGTIVLATVDGEVRRSGSVLGTQAAFWQTTPPLTVTNRVQSTGNTDIQAATKYTVSDVFGAVKYQATKDFTIYPGTTRRIDLTWDQAPWFGLFRATQSITVLGKETVVSHYVLIAPRWLPITLVVLLVIGVIYGWRRRTAR